LKGIVFTEFMEMVESVHGMSMVDSLIEDTSPPGGGIYVSTGTYDHLELVRYLQALSARTSTPIPDLLIAFGQYLMPRFRKSFPHFFNHPHLFDFLDSVHSYIHVEVRKLYPDADLPVILCQERSDKRIVVVYQSKRRLSDFGKGLLLGAAREFNTPIQLRVIEQDGDLVKFELTQTD
jgi:hypothetical protein